jgi:hypothetical protein
VRRVLRRPLGRAGRRALRSTPQFSPCAKRKGTDAEGV